MSVLGFDIGNENCVIAVVKQRGIDVLLNDESKRETPAIVSFGEKQRFLGAAGAASATMNPKSTISQVKRLIGRKFREHGVQDDLRLLPFETSEGSDGGILIHLSYLNEKQSFTPLQILAMLFSHLKEISEKNLENHVSECVIGIPSYFTDLQRRSYLQAAEIAGLKPLMLMHDCTSTALGYGIYKTDFDGGPCNVVFVDIGHCDMQVSVASFEPGKMKILSHAFDSNLGGRDFDEVLFRYFAESFKKQYNIDVYSNARASVRLRASCEKLKKVLSANPEAPLNIECLMDEKDVQGFIKREDFEKLSSDLLERISIPCHKALVESCLTPDKIHTIELVGSGSRVPAIMKVLTELFRREPKRTLNVSECVARGCALQCAMLSPAFRVRDYEVQDSFPFSIGFSLSEGRICTLSNSVLFPKGHPFPSVKILTLQKSSTFEMEAFYANEDELPPSSSMDICNYMIGPFQAPQHQKVKVKVRVPLNLHGIVTVDAASIWLIDDHTDECINADIENMQTRNHESSYSANGPSHSHSAHHRSSGDRRSKAKGTRRHGIPFSEYVHGGMTSQALSEAHEKELQLAQQDTRMERTKDRKNSLESYVYETRSKLLNKFRSYASDLEREAISSNLQQIEDWLYDEGDDESEQVYAQKLDDLKKMVDPIEHRYRDEEARGAAARHLLNSIVECRMAADPLPPKEREALYQECSKAEQWLREKSQQQDSLPKTEDPVLSSSDIKRKAEALESMRRRITRSKFSSPRSHRASDTESRNQRDDIPVD